MRYTRVRPAADRCTHIPPDARLVAVTMGISELQLDELSSVSGLNELQQGMRNHVYVPS